MHKMKRAFKLDLQRAAYRAAASLVAAETVGGGGWSLIWQAPQTGSCRAAAIIYTETAAKFQALVKIAGVYGEAREPSVCPTFTRWHEWIESASQITDLVTGKPVDRVLIDQAAKAVMDNWPQIETYAAAHLKQWEDPDTLSLFRLDLIEGSDNPPEHHRHALVSGTQTPASLHQSPEKACAIPAKIRALIH